MKTIIFGLLIILIGPTLAFAQEESYKGAVTEVNEVSCGEMLDPTYHCYEYSVYINDLETEVETSPTMSESGDSRFRVGDKVYVAVASNEIDGDIWNITGFVRETSMLIIFSVFVIVTLLVAGRQGFGSLLSLGLTVALIYLWAVPRILEGGNVILIGVLTVSVSLVLGMYISHGFNVKATISAISTLVGILIVSAVALLFTQLTRVDGTGTDDAFLLMSQTGGSIDLSAVFFVSILIAAMGVLDDVVMSQVSAIQELNGANPQLTPAQLFKQSMNIGKDHISTMVNTLFIAYAGSSFALVILLTYNSGGLGNILRIDSIAEEIVRTMSASIGILLVVPIASYIASRLIYHRKSITSV